MKGTCIHSVYNQNSIAVKGDIFAILPFISHTMRPIEGKEIELVQVDFMPFLINENMKEFSNIDSFVDFAYIQPMVFLKDSKVPRLNLSSNGQAIIESILQNMEKEIQLKDEGYRLLVKADLLRLLVIIGREFKSFNEKKQDNIVSYHRKLFYKTIEYINTNYNQKIGLKDIAKMAAMSPSYYSYIFKLIKGKNFVEYLNDIRIQKAMELLKTSDLNISEVCFAVGFNNLGHFNRVFKETAGVTPSNFRKVIIK